MARRFIDALRSLAHDPAASPFLSPVDAGTPGYFSSIPHPMDLATVLLRTLAGYYRQPAAARADVALIASNAAAFNAGLPIADSAQAIAAALLETLRERGGDEAAAAAAAANAEEVA
jgi:hypothetical protein